MLEEGKPEKHSAVLTTLSVVLAVAGAVGLIAWTRESAPTQPSSNISVSDTQTAAYTPPTPSASALSSSSDDLFPKRDLSRDDCFNKDILALKNHSTLQTRKDEAALFERQFSDFDLYVTTYGKEMEYLMVSGLPTNLEALEQFARDLQSNDTVMWTLCSDGFREVQVVTRDEGLNQKVVAKIPTSFKRSLRFMARIGGAKPKE